MDIKELYLLIKENGEVEKEFYKCIDKVEKISNKKAYEICIELKKEFELSENDIKNNIHSFKKYTKICNDFLNEIK